jgi:hypothetical protein
MFRETPWKRVNCLQLGNMMHLGIGIQEGKKFPIMPNLSKNIFHANFPKLLLMGGGGGGVVDEIFDYYITYCISHNIEVISPIYFHNKPILPDCEANIARLA